MCFSAPASFTAAAALGAVGVACETKANGPMRWFAALPILTGIQQLIEGFQWLADKPSLWSTGLGYAFLFFAFLLWPIYVPFSIYKIETNPKRQKILKIVTAIGVCVAIFFLSMLIVSPLSVTVLGASICYVVGVPVTFVGSLPYLLAVSGSALFSSRKRVQLLGVLIAIGYVIAFFVYRATFASVWCFLAALTSLLVYLEVAHNGRHAS